MESALKLEEDIWTFVQSHETRFSPRRLVAHLESAGHAASRRTLARVEGLLRGSRLVFVDDEGRYVPRSRFFRDAEFLIVPQADEIASGILIPGHRFLPFASPRVWPWQATLLVDGRRRIDRRTVRRRWSRLGGYYALYGTAVLPSILSSDHEENRRLFEAEPGADASAAITVFDLRGLYARRSFRPGDALEVRLLDWHRGVYELTAVPQEELARRQRGKLPWLRRLERGFLAAFERLGLEQDIAEQIAYAFFLGGRELLRRPPLHLGGFLAESSEVGLLPVGRRAVLRQQGEEADELLDPPPEDGPLGETGSAAALLEYLLGLSVTEADLEAYMRDALHRGAPSLASVAGRLRDAYRVRFRDASERRAYYRFLEDLWRETRGSYDAASDLRAGPLRARALGLLDAHLAWVRGLERRLSLEDLAHREVRAAARLASSLGGLLAPLGRDRDLSEGEARELGEALDGLALLMRGLRARIDGRLTPLDPDLAGLTEERLVAMRRLQTAPADTYYVLRVELCGIRPPVWRRLQVPGSFTLGELHGAIQAAMGWRDEHLHLFELADEPDEERACLGELLPRENARFDYLYDFVDHWRHRVTVQRIVPAGAVRPEHRHRAVCLAGRRAAPPEGSGGARGYAALLGALPAAALTVGAPSSSEARPADPGAAEGFDPEAFDPEAFDPREVNRLFG